MEFHHVLHWQHVQQVNTTQVIMFAQTVPQLIALLAMLTQANVVNVLCHSHFLYPILARALQVNS